MRHDCVFAGLNTVDLIGVIAEPIREDEKIPASAIVADGGGPCATAACAASFYGLDTALFTAIGTDFWTPFILQKLTDYKVSDEFVEISKKLINPVSLIINNKKTASRTIVWNSQGLGAHDFHLTKTKISRLLNTACIHFDGHMIPTALRLAKEAKKRGVLVSYDCGSPKKGWEKLAALTDIFIPSHKFCETVGIKLEKAVQTFTKKYGCLCAVTCGEKGVWYAENGRTFFMKQKKYRAADTTGCGDVFHGAFLASYLKNKNFPAALAFAQKAAGLKTLKAGGRLGLVKI